MFFVRHIQLLRSLILILLPLAINISLLTELRIMFVFNIKPRLSLRLLCLRGY
jgi:hypothetical protein